MEKEKTNEHNRIGKKIIIIVGIGIILITIVLLLIFLFPRHVIIYGKEFKNTDNYIDLSDTDYSNINELEKNLSSFKRLSVVHFGEKRILENMQNYSIWKIN